MNTIRARVIAVHRDVVHLQTPEGELVASVSDSLAREQADPFRRPTVGDWVAVEKLDSTHLRVQSIEPRVSTLVRRSAGSAHTAQLLAANVDTAFIFSPLPDPPNVRRLARLVSIALAGNITPVIVLSRTDLATPAGIANALSEVAVYLPDVPVVTASSTSDDGLSDINPWLWPGATVVLLGPSGAGKSTMLNALAGSVVMQTAATRRDGAGRHTTTHRALIELPAGLSVIDTPGLREVGVWASTDVSSTVFSDIAALAASCRFRDCQHVKEPGCAVQAAIRDGTISGQRWAQWEELRRETAFLERSQSERRKKERQGSLAMRRFARNQSESGKAE